LNKERCCSDDDSEPDRAVTFEPFEPLYGGRNDVGAETVVIVHLQPIVTIE